MSYGLYVFHGAALAVASRIVPPGPDIVFWPVLAMVAFGLTLAFSVASYRWLESPFLRMKKNYEVVNSAPVASPMMRLAA
jgi:peptidoglycan/LPS O-acetylase OafA/YrhL